MRRLLDHWPQVAHHCDEGASQRWTGHLSKKPSDEGGVELGELPRQLADVVPEVPDHNPKDHLVGGGGLGRYPRKDRGATETVTDPEQAVLEVARGARLARADGSAGLLQALAPQETARVNLRARGRGGGDANPAPPNRRPTVPAHLAACTDRATRVRPHASATGLRVGLEGGDPCSD